MTQIASYIQYKLRSQNRHGVHSPFVYRLLEEVIYARPAPEPEIEALRKQLLQNKQLIDLEDHGAGSRVARSKKRTLAEITATSTSASKISLLLSRLIRYFNFEMILELGSNTGINTAYMAKAAPSGKIIAIEGDPTLASVAATNLSNLKITNCEIVKGHFDTELEPALKKLGRLDLAYIDGNHRREPTLKYYESMLPYCHNNTLIAIGDIHWSAEMEAAWNEIKASDTNTICIDLFSLGLVFFRREQAPENFIIKF